ncbi:hypothetical protein CTAYLR_001221 [Chrysophaeum taylorii]|uniref:UBC core domain-containing protein n=1 Tax=Chrysophaeum taylorii TaxID=2483200 RepID=A0AAD7XNL3_9STRA|nr:hypothetical protein CTAYLR_001221 [Chrysophaeum taylorii]
MAAVKRIKADIRELAQNPSSSYAAAPVEDNLFLWHFTVRGPRGTDFAGGVYHGRISLPPEYPFKPPSIMLLTPNGRFETNKKICLSLTAHHPEHWQPAWGIRTILEALIAFFPTPADSSIGALQWRPDERSALAVASRDWVCPQCGPVAALLENEKSQDTHPTPPPPPPPEALRFVVREDPTPATQPPSPVVRPEPPAVSAHQEQRQRSPHRIEDALIFGLIIAIVALLLKKYLRSNSLPSS